MDAKALAATIADLRLVGKDTQLIEVKSGIGKSILETLSAFSNSEGGFIFVGLDEQTGFLPTPDFDAKKAQDALMARCAEMSPHVRPQIDVLPFEDSLVLVAEIPALPSEDKPCYIETRGRYSGSYTRTGDGDVRLEKYEIDRLLEERTQPLWDEEVVPETSTDDLAAEALNAFIDSQRALRQRTFSQGEDRAFERLRVTKGGNLTLASLLALGDYPQEFFPRLCVTFAEFPGTSKGSVTEGVRLTDSTTFNGSIPEIVEAAVEKLRHNMRNAAYIEGAFRQNLPDYPLVAVREAITNALMHRDYSPASRGTAIQMNLYIDRLEIKNPGGLYGATTLRTLGQDGISSTRNQRLATILESVTLPGGGVVAENRGTGIAVMQSALAESLMPPPEFINSSSTFTVIFRRRIVAPSEKYATVRDRVLEALTHQESASSAELAEMLAVSRSAVQKALSSLLDEKKIRQTEPARSPKQRYTSGLHSSKLHT